MLIEVKSFGGEAHTAAFDKLIFDSAECMAAFWLSQRADTARILTMRVVNFDCPAERIDARAAVFLRVRSETARWDSVCPRTPP